MARVLQFYVTLTGIEPPIWRRIQIRDNQTFWGLHCALQDVMGWQDCHLHLFRLWEGGDAALEIGIPIPDPDDSGAPTLASWQQPLAELCPEVGSHMTYLYDFGDDWYHQVRFEGSFPLERGARYPRCLGGERACPPEDVGGTGGYERFLEILMDPKHEEHGDMVAWIGRNFDPEQFDPTTVRFSQPSTRLRKSGLV